LNELFTPLSDVILEERGTIDKFMGDAVMAFWNAPLDDPDHAANACRAAVKMQQELDRLNAGWAAAAGQRPAPVEPVRIGIGLNTGACCVGNVGSPQRFDYSILGDVVNVASRLEEKTKVYGVPILAGERTAAGAQKLAFLQIEAAKIRGKERVERLFALIGDETVAQSDRYLALRNANTRLQQALAADDAVAAAEALKECRARAWAEVAPLYETLAVRIKETA
jgi:adenylate cyclase